MKNKKFLAVILCLTLTVSMLTSCSSGGSKISFFEGLKQASEIKDGEFTSEMQVSIKPKPGSIDTTIKATMALMGIDANNITLGLKIDGATLTGEKIATKFDIQYKIKGNYKKLTDVIQVDNQIYINVRSLTGLADEPMIQAFLATQGIDLKKLLPDGTDYVSAPVDITTDQLKAEMKDTEKMQGIALVGLASFATFMEEAVKPVTPPVLTGDELTISDQNIEPVVQAVSNLLINDGGKFYDTLVSDLKTKGKLSEEEIKSLITKDKTEVTEEMKKSGEELKSFTYDATKNGTFTGKGSAQINGKEGARVFDMNFAFNMERLDVGGFEFKVKSNTKESKTVKIVAPEKTMTEEAFEKSIAEFTKVFNQDLGGMSY